MKVSEAFEHLIFDKLDKHIYIEVGGYGSGKSYSIAQKLILTLLEEKKKLLVIRRYYNTHRDSTFDLLKTVLQEFPQFIGGATTSPLGIKLTNGSEILFRGLDDPSKLKSITGVSLAWIEEASEINLDGYNEVLGRLRGADHNVILMSLNPVSKSNWVYKTFFELAGINEFDFYEKKLINYEVDGIGVVIHHSTVADNPFASQEYIDKLRSLERNDPYLHTVAYKGQFGVLGDRIFTNVRVSDEPPRGTELIGLDFGMAISYNAAVRVYLTDTKLYITDEYYSRGITNQELARDLKREGLNTTTIYADSAEPKSILELNRAGVSTVKCRKFPGSVVAGIKQLQGLELIVHPKCTQTI